MFLKSLHTFQHYFSRIFEELARFDVSRAYHSTGQYTTFERCINIAPSKSRAISGTHLLKTRARTVSFKFSNLAIRAINDCLTPIDNRGRLFLTILFLQQFDEIIATLFPYKKFFSYI